MSADDFSAKYSASVPCYERLKDDSLRLITRALDGAGIKYMSVSGRVKTLESATSKVKLKKYTDPLKEMTDLIGVRVILYLASDVTHANTVIRGLFEVDENNSIDKRAPKAIDTVGYRSLHLICSLGKARLELPENRDFSGISFEVQVRTALEHAWAEIEHKENYKANQERSLPSDLQRRLMILAGTLELVDNELSAISSAADRYRQKVINGDASLANEPLNITYINSITMKKFSDLNISVEAVPNGAEGDLIEELTDFGLRTITQFQDFISEFLSEKRVVEAYLMEETNVLGITRDAMMCADLERFLRTAYHSHFGFSWEDVSFISKLTGRDVSPILQGYGINPFSG